MIKRIVALLLCAILFVGTLPLSIFATIGTENNSKPEEKVYYSDLFYAYPYLLTEDSFLQTYNADLNQVCETIYNNYNNSAKKFGTIMERTLEVVSSPSDLTKQITDTLGISDFDKNKAYDTANRKFVTQLLNTPSSDALQESYGKTYDVMKRTQSIVKLCELSSEIDDNRSAEELLLDVAYSLWEDGILSNLSTDTIAKILEELDASGMSLSKMFNLAATEVQIAQAFVVALMIEDVRMEIIDDIIDSQTENTILKEGMTRLKKQLSDGFVSYFISSYLVEAVFNKVLGTVGDLAYTAIGIKTACDIIGIAKTIVFDWLITDVPSYGDVLAYQVLTSYSISLYSAVQAKADSFTHSSLVSNEVFKYENLFSAYVAANNAVLDVLATMAPYKGAFELFREAVDNGIAEVSVNDEKYSSSLSEAEVNEIIIRKLLSGELIITVNNGVRKKTLNTKAITCASMLQECSDADLRASFTDKYKDLDIFQLHIDSVKASVSGEPEISWDYNIDKDTAIKLQSDTIEPNCIYLYDNKLLGNANINGDFDLSFPLEVKGDLCWDNVGYTFKIKANSVLNVNGNFSLNSGNPGYNKTSHSYFTVESWAKLNVGNDLSIGGYKEFANGTGYMNTNLYGDVYVNGNFNINDMTNTYIRSFLSVNGDLNQTSSRHTLNSTTCKVWVCNDAACFVNGDFNIKGAYYGNVDVNWAVFEISAGIFDVSGDLNAMDTFVSLRQTGSKSRWTIKGNVNVNALNKNYVPGFSTGLPAYACNFSAGVMEIYGDYTKIGGDTITPSGTHTIYLLGEKKQNISGVNASTLIIENKSGINFSTAIQVSKLFNHNGNQFSLYNNGKGSVFTDYDYDGVNDNLDEQPTVGKPCDIYILSDDEEKGDVFPKVFNTYGGSEITFTATPTSKYKFVKWIDSSGNTVSTSATYTAFVKSNETYTAVFTKRTQYIYKGNTTGGRVVVPSRAEIESIVEVYAYENEGYVYTENSLKYNGIVIENNSFIMPDESVIITAEFVRNENYFALREKIREAQKYSSENYILESFLPLSDAITEASAVLKNNISAEESAFHVNNIQVCIDGLIPIVLETISYERSEINVLLNQPVDNDLCFYPAGALDKTVIYSSSNMSVATIDSEGSITLLAEGQTLITAKHSSGIESSFTLNVEPYTGTLNEDNSYSLLTYAGTETSIVIPDIVDGRSVSIITGNVFAGNTSIVSVAIPDTVTAIESGAFNGCTSLQSVTIPDTITSIESSTFSDCSVLVDVQLPESLTKIGSSAFKNCSSLIDINIPGGVLSIGSGAFNGCTALCNVEIPVGVEKIQQNLFNGCSNLKSLKLPDTITHIGSYAFKNCISLENIPIPLTVLSIGSQAFYGCSSLRDISIPEGVTQINSGTFQNCYALSDVSLPKTLKEIKTNAFRQCNSIVGICIPDSVTAIENYAFCGCNSLKNINLPEGIIKIYSGCFSECYSLSEMVLPKSVKSIAVNAFKSCINLKQITIYDNVTAIGSSAFDDHNEALVINCYKGTTAETFAIDNSIAYRYLCSNIDVDNYIVTINHADQIDHIRYASGEHTTVSSIKNAADRVDLSASVIAKNTVDGNFVYTMPDGGYYTFWMRMSDGTEYFLAADMTKFTPTVDTNGVKITVDGLYDAKDFFIAKGEFNSYNEIKTNGYIVRVTDTKIAGKHNYTYTVTDPGIHTVLVRYNDGREFFFHEELTVDEPVFTTNGLQVIISNIPDVKVIRTAYGEYNTPGDTKRAEGARNYSNKAVIKDAEEYTLQYREEGRVTIVVEYNNGYVKVFHYDVTKKVPTKEHIDDTVIFGNLDGLVMIRYAMGEYATSSEIKKAEGSKVIKPDAIVDGKITVTDLAAGTYTFCVQFDDESYNYYTVEIIDNSEEGSGDLGSWEEDTELPEDWQ